ncbi:MAG: response regulator [Alphaproteobacteria bacterium]
MPKSTLIAPHLAYLRRFARALSGSQASGDRYVAAVLEAIVSDPDVLDDRLHIRVALYRLIVTIWDSVSGADVATPHEAGADRSLDSMMPRTRQVFLLTAVEGFTVAEVAAIMSTDEDEVHALIAAAGEEIASEIATRVLIIEDEPLIAMDIRSLVEGLGHEVTSVARTHDAAVKAARDDRPGLILADVQLADGSSGIEAVNELLDEFAVPVIFITAYPERLLTGTQPEPTFVIAKPFQAEYVKAIISQALFFDMRAKSQEAG